MQRHVDLSSSSDRKRGRASHFVPAIYRFCDRFAVDIWLADIPDVRKAGPWNGTGPSFGLAGLGKAASGLACCGLLVVNAGRLGGQFGQSLLAHAAARSGHRVGVALVACEVQRNAFQGVSTVRPSALKK